MAQESISRGRVALAGVIGATLVLALTRAIYGAIRQRMRKPVEAEGVAPETADEAGEVWVVVDEVWIT